MSTLGPAAVLSHAEVESLLCAILPPDRRRDSSTAVRNHALVTLLYRTGLRCGEALQLTLGDLRLEHERPTLRVKSGKTEEATRTVGLSQDLLISLERWLRIRRRLPGKHAFCTLKGERLDSGYVREMLARKGKQAGIERCHPHALRATLAVELVLEGQSLPVVRDVLGHRSLVSTDYYLRRVFPDKAVDALVARGT